MLLSLLAMYGIAFFLKDSDGPWGIMSWFRNQLMQNKHVGVFFYKLLSCYFCVGFHAGWIVYLLQANKISIGGFIVWGFVGAATNYILEGVMMKLASPNEPGPMGPMGPPGPTGRTGDTGPMGPHGKDCL